MLASHYAPGKPVRLGATYFADDEFGIGFGALGGDYQLSAAGDLTEAAAHLFDALHAGAASAKARIAMAAIPVEGRGEARSEEHTSELQSLMRSPDDDCGLHKKKKKRSLI